MAQLVLNTTARKSDTVPSLDERASVDAHAIARDRPDANWSLIDRNDSHAEIVTARCSLWWKDTPRFEDHRVGVIGHFEVENAAAAREILSQACDELRAHDCTLAVGPMDGNTWRPYRLVTEPGDEPPFFLEPSNPTAWPGHFHDRGFTVLAEYLSGLDEDLGRPDPLLQRTGDQMQADGILIRRLDLAHLSRDLSKIHSVASIAFRDNLLFTPIDQETFIELFRPLEQCIVRDFVLIAEQRGRPVGFLFAIPDFLRAERLDSIDTLIVKTLAILPGSQYAGLGHLMLYRARMTAHRLGYTRLIKALVRDVSPLRRLTFKDARQIRRYALFAKELRS